jgi:hypothetical protein
MGNHLQYDDKIQTLIQADAGSAPRNVLQSVTSCCGGTVSTAAFLANNQEANESLAQEVLGIDPLPFKQIFN